MVHTKSKSLLRLKLRMVEKINAALIQTNQEEINFEIHSTHF